MNARLVPVLVGLTFLSGCMVGERPAEGEDTDGDFLINPFEEQGWNVTVATRLVGCGTNYAPITYSVNSSAYDRDTDADGLDDSDEYLWFSDPRKRDTDGDGIGDNEEVQLSRSNQVRLKGALRPTLYDSDRDCLSDGEEINGTDIPGLGLRTSDPSVADTDQDGLSDFREVRETLTDPRNPDTDGDGADDRRDIDPRRNIALRLVFESVQTKASAAGEDVRFSYVLQAVPDDVIVREAPTFRAARGTNASVPAAQSPQKVDVDDLTLHDSNDYFFQWWLETGGADVLNVTSYSGDRIVSMVVNPVKNEWRAGPIRGATDGTLTRIGGADADVWFRLWVETA